MTLSAGAAAPDFTLFHQKGESVTLSDLKGEKVVLLFLPAAFSGVCDDEVCAIQEDLGAYSALGAKVLAITVDGLFTTMRFGKEYSLEFPVLSDWDRVATNAYGVRWDDFAGIPGFHVANRAVFVIDESGTVTYAWAGENPGVYPNFDDVKSALS